MRIFDYICLIIILMGVGFVYRRYINKYETDDELQQYNLIKKYLLNDSSITRSKKPIIWIHTDYHINANHWTSFGSRNTRAMNQPYKLLTIKSIIDKCGGDFSVCMIDDRSFSKLVPDWKIDMDALTDPIRSNIRQLGLARLLKTFGGFVVPGSMICLRNLKETYEKGVLSMHCSANVGKDKDTAIFFLYVISPESLESSPEIIFSIEVFPVPFFAINAIF